MPLAKSCNWISCVEGEWWCSQYGKIVRNCGEDCPKYKYDRAMEMINLLEETLPEGGDEGNGND